MNVTLKKFAYDDNNEKVTIDYEVSISETELNILKKITKDVLCMSNPDSNYLNDVIQTYTAIREEIRETLNDDKLIYDENKKYWIVTWFYTPNLVQFEHKALGYQLPYLILKDMYKIHCVDYSINILEELK